MSEGLSLAKRRRVGSTRPKQRRMDTEQSEARILQLSDDVLMLILENLTTLELIILANTCLRFQSLCLETKSLWINPNFSGHPTELKRIKKCLSEKCINVLNESTRSLTLGGRLMSKGQLNMSEAYLSNIAKVCPEIRTLRLLNFSVNEGKILFEHLPSSLTKLSLIESEFISIIPDPYFKSIHTKLPNLEELNLTNCEWVTDYFLLQISKIETLKVLTLFRDCYIVAGYRMTKRGIGYITAEGASNIERLTLVRCNLSDWALRKMASEMKRLKYLDIRRSYGVTTDGIKLFKSIVESRPPGASQFCEILF